jgi:hypothetical protein
MSKKQKVEPVTINIWDERLPDLPGGAVVIIRLFETEGPRAVYTSFLNHGSVSAGPEDLVAGSDYLLDACYRDYQAWRRRTQPISAWEEWAGIEMLLRLYQLLLDQLKHSAYKQVESMQTMIGRIHIKMLSALRQELYQEQATAWQETDQAFADLVACSGHLKEEILRRFSTKEFECIDPSSESGFMGKEVFSVISGAFDNKLRNQDDFDRAMQIVETIDLKRLQFSLHEPSNSAFRIKGRMYKPYSPL